MFPSRAWFVLAVAAVLGLFYVGHGLHSQHATTLPLASPAYGQEQARRDIEWRGLGETQGGHFYRAKIQGGWLILVVGVNRNGMIANDITFVPDAEHQWNGTSLDW